MGKQSKREYREEEEYVSVPTASDSDDSSASSNSPSGSSSSSGSDDSSSERERRQRRHIKKRSKRKREKRSRRGNSSEEEEEEEDDGYGEPEYRKKRARHTVEEHSEERKHSGRRKRHHHHHHRKHKHKHRHHRRHHSEERSKGSGEVYERPFEGRRGRELEERRGRERLDPDRERRALRDNERRERKEEKRNREKGRSEARPVKSKWDDEEDTLYDPGRRIKVEPGLEGDGSEGDWDGEYENGGGRKRRHQQQQLQQQHQRRRQQQQENSHRLPHRVKEEPGSRLRQDASNSTTAAENGRTGWGHSGGGGGGGGGGGSGDGGGAGGGRSEDPGVGEERQKPNLAVTGKLAEDANTYNGVVIKYSQPPEARKPKRRWRWYIFKGDEELPFLPLHRQSAYLIGRDRKVADIPTDHPSCSKQHAVLQYRLVTYNREDGTKGRTVKPYILDLESANGTYVNNRRIDAKRFVELLEKDVVKFGYSSREYILLHEGSKGDDEDMPDTGTDLSPVSMLRS